MILAEEAELLVSDIEIFTVQANSFIDPTVDRRDLESGILARRLNTLKEDILSEFLLVVSSMDCDYDVQVLCKSDMNLSVFSI